MNRSSRSDFRPSSRRRGVTLVEMLVTVAVLIIIMTILVQVFQAATGACRHAQSLAQLDDGLRRLDGTIRSDLLQGDGADSRHHSIPRKTWVCSEYGESEFRRCPGEDSDDYIRNTTKAPQPSALHRPHFPELQTHPFSSEGAKQQVQNISRIGHHGHQSICREIIYFLTVRQPLSPRRHAGRAQLQSPSVGHRPQR